MLKMYKIVFCSAESHSPPFTVVNWAGVFRHNIVHDHKNVGRNEKYIYFARDMFYAKGQNSVLLRN